MAHQTKTYATAAEYLDLEREAEHKSEYFGGEIHAMTGASRRHNLITTNIVRELSQRLRARPCEVYSSDMRVAIPTAGVYTYPDVAVVCGAPEFEDEHADTLLNPTLIVEVLSKSTAKYDRTLKFDHYRALSSLAEYLLVAQDECRVEQYAKQADGRWMLTDIRSPESVVELVSVGCALPLREVYERIEFS